jgi:recombinational DNA repair protein (RecF pathway)
MSASQQALVWQRADFRESSRLVTLITRDGGKTTTLAKGAHRPDSPFLGRIDFLNLIAARLGRGSLPILHRVKLLHEHRGLRQPHRYLCAGYLCELFDPATGGLRLLERCPEKTIPQVILGVELRLLHELGSRPSLGACARCGAEGALHAARHQPALLCARHREGSGGPVPKSALAWLQQAARCSGRELPDLPPVPAAASRLLGRFVSLALDKRPKLRQRALATKQASAAPCPAGAQSL